MSKEKSINSCQHEGCDATLKIDREAPLLNTNQIQLYVHCGLCLAGLRTGQKYSQKLAVGWTAKGLQVWCDIHDVNVMHIDFEGHTHPANMTVNRPASTS